MDKTAFIVEDEENIRDLVSAVLSSAGFAPSAFESGSGLFVQLEQQLPQLILLDIMLPGESGLDILRRLKDDTRTKDIPVLLLTAKSSELDKVTGLELGADDYIVKPFGVLELLARIKAVLRRVPAAAPLKQPGSIQYRDLTLDTLQKCVFKEGKQLPLTYKEYELLLYLHKNRGIVLSRDQLLEQVWNYGFEIETRTVDSHIRSLRNKIGDKKGDDAYIVTNRGYGYMLQREDS